MSEQPPDSGRFKYHLELTPAQLKITHTALHSLLDDFGHEQSDVHELIREVLDKLPDQHAMRAVRLDDELERELNRPAETAEAAPRQLEAIPGDGDGDSDDDGDGGPAAPGPSAA